MKKNKTDIELLSAYIDGELSPAEKKYIEDKIKSLILEHRKRRGSHLGVVFRTVIDPNGATLYKEGYHGKG